MGKKANAKDWKAVTLDWLALLEYDQVDTINICLTQRQVAILKALLSTAYWATRWTNLTISADQLDDFVAQIDSQLDGNDCGVCNMQFRENPADICEVQYSTDGGQTWATMFRKDTCNPVCGTQDIDNSYTTITNIENDNTTWNNDITNVAPDWAYVDTYSDNALCWAIDFYVDMICDVMIAQIKGENEKKRSDNDWLEDVEQIITTGVVAAIAATTGAVAMPAIVVGAVAWASVQIVDSVWDFLVTVDYSAFEDEEARQVIKCIMYQAQNGETPQFPNWRDSLEFWETLDGNAKAIGKVVHLWNQEEDIYIQYMLLMEDINSIRDTLPECPCPDRWEHVWNFATHGLEAWQITDQMWGSFSPGIGVNGTIEDTGGGYTSVLISYLSLLETIPRCDGWTIYYVADRGDWDQNATSLLMENPPEAGDTQMSGWFQSGQRVWKQFMNLNDLTQLKLMIRASRTIAGDNGAVLVWKIMLEGVGENPFYGRETS